MYPENRAQQRFAEGARANVEKTEGLFIKLADIRAQQRFPGIVQAAPCPITVRCRGSSRQLSAYGAPLAAHQIGRCHAPFSFRLDLFEA